VPRIPGLAVVLAAVALTFVCVSAFDALSVGWEVRELAADEDRDAAAIRAEIDELTSRNLRGDTVGIVLGLVLGAVSGVLLFRARRPAPASAPVPAPVAPPLIPAESGHRNALDAAAFLEADPDDLGPNHHEVASAVNRVRRQVVARYTRAEADRDELANIVDMAFDAFVGVDADGRIVRWNSRAEQLFGWSREEAIGRPVLGTAFGPPRAMAALSPGDLRALAAGHPDEPAELTAWHRSGKGFPVEVALSVAGDAADGMVYAFVRDISRRRRSERRERAIHLVTRALAEAETPEEASIDVLKVLCASYDWTVGATWTQDPKTGLLRVMGTFGENTARLRHWREACAREVLEVGHGLPGEAWTRGAVAYREDRPTTLDDPRQALTARSGMRSAICLPLLIDGETVGVIELFSGTRRAIEPWLLDDLAAVQQVVAAYIERRRAREASERAKREFLTLVSHELRTPLTSIMGYVQMLRSRVAGQPEERSVAIIGRNADRLHRLVGDLLFAAEISRGQLRLEPAELSLAAVVGDAADAARPAAEARSVEVVSDLGADVPLVEGDAGRLSQVLDNLLSNAIKFSHEGGRVEVVLRAGADAVTVAVRDHGIGVAAAEVDRIATQFFRAETAQSAQVPGMGLGLSLSKAIVEGHGGTLDFASVEGAGTTVTVALPRAAPVPAALVA
jgi:PAS domain S-box-containing protein